MIRIAALAFAGLTLGASPSRAESCREPKAEPGLPSRTEPCPPARKVEPYDPDRARAGREPGFIDLGGGTEIRIGGRVRTETDLRRRP